ncbi:MAG: O-methyltransferase [Oscillospiraceae bacterium]|nr:O-methyltransferase [Oscillospiraceae bacterium]
MDKWTNSDIFIIENLIENNTIQENTLKVSRKNNLLEAEVSPSQGKFLYLLARIKNAKRILELGTLGGYSTIWLAQAVGDGGIVMTVEYVENYADVAKQNIEYAGFSDRVKILKGDASDILVKLIEEKTEPFDMIFIDADKASYPLYLELSLQLSKPGTIIYGDNIVRDGELCKENSTDEKVIGVRKFIEDLGKLETVESTALQTVGIKGYDGFTLSVVK